MSLAGIGTGIAASLYLAGSAQLQQLTTGVRHPNGISGLGNDTVSLSGQGQFLSKLQALQASNPQKFKDVLSQAASDLQTAAAQAGNTAQGQSFSNLATKFQDVANGGDISQLKPTTYTNRVQRAYGSHQSDGVEELLNRIGQNQAGGIASMSAATAGTNASASSETGSNNALKSVFSSLSTI
jgi:hypothetical protein